MKLSPGTIFYYPTRTKVHIITILPEYYPIKEGYDYAITVEPPFWNEATIDYCKKEFFDDCFQPVLQDHI